MGFRAGIASAVIFIFLSGPSAVALDNSQARTPPMGFSTWNWFACGEGYPYSGLLDDVLIRGIADAMVSSGMKDVGYRYVNIDDCWVTGWDVRDSHGGLISDPVRFPDMRKLAAYIHGKGLSFGLYLNCETNAGHEQQDADSIVAWGADFLKYDFCDQAGFIKMRDCLKTAVAKARAAGNAAAHEIVYSLSMDWHGTCAFGDTVGNLWRTGDDINISWATILKNIETNDQCNSRSRPGAWNDPDMMEVGNGLPVNEDRAHFSLWCMMAAPLLASNDLRSMSAATKTILTNSDMIAIDQDSLGFQGKRVKQSGNLEVWAKKLKSGDVAVCFFNKGTAAADMSVTWGELATGLGMTISSTKTFKVRDLWKHQNLSDATGSIAAAAVPSHDVTVLRLYAGEITSAVRPVTPTIVPGITALLGNGLITVTAPVAVVSLVNMQGAAVAAGRTAGGRWTFRMRDLRSGMYVLTVRTGANRFSRTVVAGSRVSP